jgi:hypothetical protein
VSGLLNHVPSSLSVSRGGVMTWCLSRDRPSHGLLTKPVLASIRLDMQNHMQYVGAIALHWASLRGLPSGSPRRSVMHLMSLRKLAERRAEP